MIERILGWLTGAAPNGSGGPQDGLQLALTALLVEAAHCDDHFDEGERAVIKQMLERRFELSHHAARVLLAAGEREAGRAAELFHFTRIINERLSFEQRIELIEMLWEVAYADGVLDQYEDSLLRRVSGLIYVPDRKRGMAQQRVLGRLGLNATA